MPCYKGIAVSIHANGALEEFGIVRQSRVSRVTSYIPVPEPTLNPDTGVQEPAKFAISITLLTKGLAIPYSTLKPTEDNPNPRPHIVGAPGQGISVSPYIPLTSSENETIAAYIYFDGRAKEEVATLLRPGEETWVNSRWVQVPESEGGGLAEREFLFREVALERWLNGLDLTGHDAADKVEKRRQKYEKKQRRQEKAAAAARSGDSPMPTDFHSNSDDSDDSSDDDIPESTGQIKVAMFRVLASGEIKKGEYSPQFDAHDDDDDTDIGNQNGGGGAVGADVEHTTSFAKPKSLDPKTISTQTVTGIDGPDKPYATFTFFYRGRRQLEKMNILPTTRNQGTPSSATKRRSTQLELPKLGPLKTTGTVGFSTFRDQDAEASRRRKSRKKSNAGSPAAMDADSDSDVDDDYVTGKMEDIDEKDVDPTDAGGKMSPEESKFSGELADGVERIHVSSNFNNFISSDNTSSNNSKGLGIFSFLQQLKRARSADPDSIAGGATPTGASGSGGALGPPPQYPGSLPRDSPRGTPPIPGGGLGLGLGLGLSSTPPDAKGLLGDSIKPAPSAIGTGAASGSGPITFGGSAGGGAGGGLPDESVIGSPLKKHRPSLHDDQLSRAAGLGGILAGVQQQQQGGGGSAAANPSNLNLGPPLQQQPPPHIKEEIKEEEEEL